MLDHIVEFVGLLRMALLHGRYDIHHPTPGLCCSQMTTRTKKNEFCDIAVVKADATTIRPTIFPNLKPDDISLIFKPPRFHRLKPPRQKSIGAPKVEMGFFGSNL